jgi:sulfur relay (sulfurtransferase) DsrF/TusC family protein
MNALPIYDCEDIYYSRTDLEYLQLDRSCINTVARELEPEDIQQLITKQQFCLSF